MFKPYEECFCESGKKFKFCCGNVKKTDEKVITFQTYEYREMEKVLTNAKKNHNYICLYPGCEERAISSHSIQENRFLDKLSSNGHVFQVDMNLKTKVAYINLEDKGLVRMHPHFMDSVQNMIEMFFLILRERMKFSQPLSSFFYLPTEHYLKDFSLPRKCII